MRSIIALALLTSACGPQAIGDLPRPALVVVITEAGEFCTSVHAVASDGATWRQASCSENDSFVRAETTVGAADRSALDAQMDLVLALPDDADCDSPSPSGRRYRFLRTLMGTNEWPDVRQCDPAVPTVALALSAELERLTSPPIADAGAIDAGM